jgi:hypothetical protein
MFDYHLVSPDDVRTSWMNFILLGRKSAAIHIFLGKSAPQCFFLNLENFAQTGRNSPKPEEIHPKLLRAKLNCTDNYWVDESVFSNEYYLL